MTNSSADPPLDASFDWSKLPTGCWIGQPDRTQIIVQLDLLSNKSLIFFPVFSLLTTAYVLVWWQHQVLPTFDLFSVSMILLGWCGLFYWLYALPLALFGKMTVTLDQQQLEIVTGWRFMRKRRVVSLDHLQRLYTDNSKRKIILEGSNYRLAIGQQLTKKRRAYLLETLQQLLAYQQTQGQLPLLSLPTAS